MITLLTGENSYAISQAVRERTSAFAGEVEKYDGLEIDANRLADIFTGISLFSTERLVVVNSPAQNKQLWHDLEKWIVNATPETNIIFVEPSPDKRTRTYKALQKHAQIHLYEPLSTQQLVNWLENEMRGEKHDMSNDTARALVLYVGPDQWRLRSELDKLLLAGKTIDIELIHQIAEPYPTASAFELLDSIFAGKLDKAERLIELMAEREDAYKFLGLLSSQLLAMLGITTGGQRRSDEIARDIGVHPYVVKNLTTTAKRLGRRHIIKAVNRLAECDHRIKTSGVEPWDQLRRTLLGLSDE